MPENSQFTRDDDVPTFEPWLAVAASALIPAALALFLPPTFLVPLIVATLGLFALSLLMWRRQSMKRRGAEP